MNDENLLKGEATRFRAGEEQVRIARAGGIASGEARRAAAVARKWLNSKGDNGTILDDIILYQIKIAKGNAKGHPTKAYEALLKTIGELLERMNITTGIDEAETLAKLIKEADL